MVMVVPSKTTEAFAVLFLAKAAEWATAAAERTEPSAPFKVAMRAS